MNTEEKIKQLEEEIRKTPYHKATEHHIGRLRARIAQLKDQLLSKASSGGGGGGGYAVRQSGDASVALIGPPSVGKSTLINQLTNTQSKVGGFEFTTLNVVPGMMEYQGAKILVFDVPGIIKGASQGKGRGKEVLSVARSVDLLLLIVDVGKSAWVKEMKKELYQFGLRLDETPPLVEIKKLTKGGIKVIHTTPLSHLSVETIRGLAKEFRLSNAEIIIKENITLNRLIDAFLGNRVYLSYLVVINKVDLIQEKKILPNTLSISARDGRGLDELRQLMWEKLKLVRVFMKRKKSKADLDEPLIVRKGTKLKEILTKLPLDQEEIKKAKIYGLGAKFEGQEVSFDFQPLDGTIVSFL